MLGKEEKSGVARREIMRVGCTNRGTLRVLPSYTIRKHQKIVVGDQSGTLTCFKYKPTLVNAKLETEIVFQHSREQQPVTAVAVDSDRIFAANGQKIEGYTKKGKSTHSFNLSLNEDITSLCARDTKLFCAGEYIYNCYDNEKDLHFFMSNDIIHCLIVVDLNGDKSEWTPIIGAQDKTIRMLSGSDIMHSFEVDSAVLTLHQIPMSQATTKHESIPDDSLQIVYGTEQGTIGQLFVSAKGITKGWTVSENNRMGSVNCMATYSFINSDFPQIIVGRDSGIVNIYQYSLDTPPFIVFSEQVNESITSVGGGFVTGIASADVIVCTYSGKIIAFQCNPETDFLAWNAAELQSEFQFAASPQKSNITRTEYVVKEAQLKEDIQTLQRELLVSKNKYQTRSRELVAVETQFTVKHSLKLITSEACYLLTVEIGIPIDIVAIDSSVAVASLDVDKHYSIMTQHNSVVDPLESKLDYSDDSNDTQTFKYFVFHSDTSTTRFSFKFRAMEGTQGQLRAYIVSNRVPKTCQKVDILIKALSLHSSITEIPKQVHTSLPMNTLQMRGDFSVRAFNCWIEQCLPDVPTRVTSDSIQIIWQSALVNSYLAADIKNGRATFESDSLSVIATLQEFLTKLAIDDHAMMSSVNVDINTESFMHFLNLIRPKLEYHQTIFQQYSLISALQEISSHENETEIACLSASYRTILETADDINTQFKTAPKHLQFIQRMVWNHINNFCRMRNITFGSTHRENLSKALSQCDCDALLKVAKEISIG